MVEMDNWTVDSKEADQKNGKMLAVCSILGPFFKFSLFAEDDARIAEKYFKRDSESEFNNELLTLISKQVQPILALPRVNFLTLLIV